METLVHVLKYNGSVETDPSGVLVDPDAFPDIEIQLVIEFKENEKTGKSFPEIKWINSLSKSNHKSVSGSSLKQKLAQVGFQALFLITQEGGADVNRNIETSKVFDSEADNESSFTEEDIPF
jgi:hypothetical protein